MKKVSPTTHRNGCPFPLELVLETARGLLRPNNAGTISQSQIEAAAECSMKLLMACQRQVEAFEKHEANQQAQAAIEEEQQHELRALQEKYPVGLSFDEYAVFVTTKPKAKNRLREEAIDLYKQFKVTELEQEESEQPIPSFRLIYGARSIKEQVQDDINKARDSQAVYQPADAMQERCRFAIWYRHHVHGMKSSAGAKGQQARQELENGTSAETGPEID